MTGKCFASMIEEHRELYFHLRQVQSKCKYLCMQTMVRAVPRVELLLGFIRWASAKGHVLLRRVFSLIQKSDQNYWISVVFISICNNRYSSKLFDDKKRKEVLAST